MSVTQCESFDGMSNTRCCFHSGHSGDHLYSHVDESDAIRWKLAADDRDSLTSALSKSEGLLKERDAELAQYRENAPLVRLVSMLGLGEPVRPDIHALVRRKLEAAEKQRDSAITERDSLREENARLMALTGQAMEETERAKWILDAARAWLKSRDHIRVDLWTARECDLLRAIVEYDAAHGGTK